MAAPYATVEDVQDALEERADAYDTPAIRQALATGTDDADDAAQCLAGDFRPTVATRYFRWPPEQTSTYSRLWLDANRLISVTTLVSGGVTVPPTDYFLEPQPYGPPYGRIEIDLAGGSAFSPGDTVQRAIAVTGLWGWSDDRRAGGALVGAVNASATTWTVSDASLVGIGDQLVVDSERVEVTGRTWSVVTGGATAAGLSASAADRSLTVADGTRYHAGESILVDAERMRIADIAGNVLVVQRARDGSVLAAHLSATAVYAQRALTVARADAGTVAASHLDAAPISVHQVPAAVRELTVASALSSLLARRRGYARESGPATGAGTVVTPSSLAELRARIESLYSRQARTRVI